MKDSSSLIAKDLANMLRSGMTEEFEAQFRRFASDFQTEGLVNLVNDQLKYGSRKSDLKLLLSERQEKNQSYVTVVGDSRFFGDSWSTRRLSFSI